MIESLAITPEETGCAGRFCDKQRIVEVMQYNQGCACYSYDSRHTNAVIDHTLNIEHHFIVFEDESLNMSILGWR